ncbi:MAG TPA: acyltransferase [Solirubrobacteraceae bacterium]|jgi:peptidoglycan/LPS O-acetylase OafA/YrhL|nr:acyltransferase [Solirubrobacteraceae bacterium]
MSAIAAEPVAVERPVSLGPATSPPAPPAPAARQPRPRLTHVDAMRPVKQLGVVSTHSLQWFAPAANIGVGAGLMLTHVTRFAFMFISAAMLVYAYPAVARGGWRTFWRRRLLIVALPYVTWTVIYFALGIVQSGRVGSITGDAGRLGSMLLTGYDQLYFLLLLLQFYLVYPAFLWLVRRTEHHHRWLLGASFAVQLVLFWLVHEQALPTWMLGKGATRELWNYELFVVAGAVMASHYRAVHTWLCSHWRALLAAAVAAVAFGEAWYVLAALGVPGFGGSNPSDPFQAVEIPLYLGLIILVYLLAVLMTSERCPRRVRALVRAGADYSYGIYLSQVLVATPLTILGWRSLDRDLPWEVVTAGGIVVIFVTAGLLTVLLARLPGARATVGIPRRPWRTTNGGFDGSR